ncbi:putative HTH-type transcriptional regulator [Streptomyces sp. RB5]|uniref:Putative HTH-type transcriptional regulator n=1 Tax=Streptomyces smaragdinus TaxID=2585196 RepID=A0A7K0CEE6_9ACTN|nr:TetR/AcrR family transcriptional regulator [Streptomyces smaragdinus]MQY11713.1 putative HTH-type transcriptional regulator [Streptomyces smaragdinus]
MAAIRGARERARAEITAAIRDEARRRLAEDGAAKLSLRAVARELGMVSSALYRYYPSRDDLLTALIVDAYDGVGAAAEAALRAAPADPPARWAAVCRAVRTWALAHPHEYALIHGSPVPGYEAPETTLAPASRVGLCLFGVVVDAHREGGLEDQGDAWPPGALADAARIGEQIGMDLPPASGAAVIVAWAQLHGLVSFEVFGQFTGVVEARDAFFDRAVAGLGRSVGLAAY